LSIGLKKPVKLKLTITLNVLVAVLPWLSVALQVTVVLPSANCAPLAGRQ
jgi:hypothetical protein